MLGFTEDKTVGKVASSIGWVGGKLNDLGISDQLYEQAFEIMCQRVRKMVEVEFYVEKLRALAGDGPIGLSGCGDESPRSVGADMGYETGSSNSSPDHSTEYFDPASPPEFVTVDSPEDAYMDEPPVPAKKHRLGPRSGKGSSKVKRCSDDEYVLSPWLDARVIVAHMHVFLYDLYRHSYLNVHMHRLVPVSVLGRFGQCCECCHSCERHACPLTLVLTSHLILPTTHTHTHTHTHSHTHTHTHSHTLTHTQAAVTHRLLSSTMSCLARTVWPVTRVLVQSCL